MRRNLAVLCILVGTVLFGIAAGYVYLDQREIQIRYLRAKAEQPGSEAQPVPIATAPGGAMDAAAFDAVRKEFINRAMVMGPLGAGLLLAGAAMVLLELPWFRRNA